MSRFRRFPLILLATLFLLMLSMTACDSVPTDNSKNSTPPPFFSQDDYLIALSNGYKGTFSDFFLEHNQIKDIKIIDNTIYAYLNGDVVVNLGTAAQTVTPPSDNSASERFYFHLSFDDTMNSLKNLTSSAPYKSVFEEPFFAYLKGLHEKYGAKFSLYTYLNILEGVTDKYQSELGAASDWLKFGMRDAAYGPIGFLSSEHEWPSYYLTREQHMYAYNHEHIVDYKNGLVFVATDMRIDWFMDDYTTTNVYRKPIKSNIYDELEYRFSDIKFANTVSSYLVFGHEWMYYDGKTLSDESQVWLDDICRFAYDQGIPFDYPQNRPYTPTPMDIH